MQIIFTTFYEYLYLIICGIIVLTLGNTMRVQLQRMNITKMMRMTICILSQSYLYPTKSTSKLEKRMKLFSTVTEQNYSGEIKKKQLKHALLRFPDVKLQESF